MTQISATETDNHLIKLVKSYSDTKILVVGDIILDKFVYGSVDRISPESPVPVLALSREDRMLGGAGNAFSNLISLGVQAHCLSVIGFDSHGEELASLMQDGTYTLITDESRPTSVKTRFLAGHQQLLRSDFEESQAVSQKIANQVLEAYDKLLPETDVVIVSDYGKGLLRTDVLARVIERAVAADIPVIVDPKGQDFSIYKGATAVTPNKKELSEAARGLPTKTDEEIVEAARTLLQHTGIESIIATRSKDGISVIPRSGDATHVRSTQNIEVFDVSGAGDTVIATVAATVAAGGSLVDAATLANAAGSIAVTKVGTAPIRMDELLDALSDQSLFQPTQAKHRIAPNQAVQDAADQVKRWKARGLKVGFTNGCFDIVHAGHVTYLDEARSMCDRLIVGLNSDSSVHILKGPGRPIHDENARATVLGALSSIDMVVLFGAKEAGDDNTANALIQALEPDIYFKGGDYKVEDIPETPTVRAGGGEVHVLSVVDGYSTTAAVEKIKKDAA